MQNKFKAPVRIESSMMENISEFEFISVGSDRIKFECGTVVNSIAVTMKKKDAQNFARALYIAAGGKITF